MEGAFGARRKDPEVKFGKLGTKSKEIQPEPDRVLEDLVSQRPEVVYPDTIPEIDAAIANYQSIVNQINHRIEQHDAHPRDATDKERYEVMILELLKKKQGLIDEENSGATLN